MALERAEAEKAAAAAAAEQREKAAAAAARRAAEEKAEAERREAERLLKAAEPAAQAVAVTPEHTFAGEKRWELTEADLRAQAFKRKSRRLRMSE